jgi:NAD(P)H-flavin reductase
MSLDLPRPARVLERVQEARDIFTLRLRYTDDLAQQAYRFAPGQFNMLYLHGVGEVPISIVSDPRDSDSMLHTIRDVGRTTHGLAALQVGDELGVRGPFGHGWPLRQARGHDLLIMTGGLGCAPVVSAINYVLRRRENYGRLTILQGVRHVNDLIWREQYARWAELPETQVLLAADLPGDDRQLFRGNVVELFRRVELEAARTLALLCGPEVMMLAAVGELRARGFADDTIWLSLERNMQCADGLCGHCQIGPRYVCRDGPVFAYHEIADWFGKRGF